jgi:HAMP domain-containing protein
LTPSVKFDAKNWIVRIPQLAAVPANELQDRVGSLEGARDELKRALDILIDGF